MPGYLKGALLLQLQFQGSAAELMLMEITLDKHLQFPDSRFVSSLCLQGRGMSGRLSLRMFCNEESSEVDGVFFSPPVAAIIGRCNYLMKQGVAIDFVTVGGN